MPDRNDHGFANRLLRAMTQADADLLSAHMTRVTLPLRNELETPGEAIKTVYFPEDCLGSVIAQLSRGRDIEVGVVGRDGLTGTGIVYGDECSPYLCIVQIPGTAMAIKAQDLSACLARSPSLNQLLLRYCRAFSIQIASTALANGRSKLEERLARWLLMVSDRLDTEKIALTHEFLAVMLGVRRPGVTVALHILEGKGLIRSTRGVLVIRDREGLIELSDGAYGMPESEYKRVMGFDA